jgi:uncharacterized membrane protein YfcA
MLYGMIESMFFEVAGITAPLWLPPLVAFAISFFTSMVGVSGAFLLMPFQMSVLGYVAPSVSATNLVFNLVAIPSGVWSYTRQKRMDWTLAWLIATGTLPGLLAGWWLRVHWLLDPYLFKLFVGLVLIGLCVRLTLRKEPDSCTENGASCQLNRQNRTPIFLMALFIGVIGGAYGIGGGSIMAPLLVAIFSMSVHCVAGAALFGTFVTSVIGVLLYQFLPAPTGIETRPDWALGVLFGIGGVAGMYAGARVQKYVPQRKLELGIAAMLGLLAGWYVIEYLLGVGH